MENFSRLIEFISLLNSITDFDEILRVSLEKVSKLVKADVSSILMINPQTQDTIKTLINEEKYPVTGKYHFVNSTISGWVVKNEQPFLSNDLKNDRRFREKLFADIPFNKSICVPIISSGKVTGAVILLSQNSDIIYSDSDIEAIQSLSTVISPYIYKSHKIQEYFNKPVLSDNVLINKYRGFGLIGRSTKFLEMLRAIESVSKCDVRVLLEGETGTGKELIAKAIHRQSSRSGEKVITLDCGAFPTNLIESELFGYVKGAFTGALTDRKGLLEEADNGTLFIDEISLLPFEQQSRFLRFVQEGEFRPIGSNEIKKVDVRIISASSSSLMKQVNKGSFREELYYRLNVYPIEIPTLNKRSEDIPLLTNEFIKNYALEQNKKAQTVDEGIMYLFLHREWKGNIRELENFCERLVTIAKPDDIIISQEYLPSDLQREVKKLRSSVTPTIILKPLEKVLEEYEEQMIRVALIQNNWNQSKAAEALSIKEQTLRYKMKKLSIVPPG